MYCRSTTYRSTGLVETVWALSHRSMYEVVGGVVWGKGERPETFNPTNGVGRNVFSLGCVRLFHYFGDVGG